MIQILTYRSGDLVPLTYWALSKTSGCLILASLPAMRQLFHHTAAAKKVSSYLNSKRQKTQDGAKRTQVFKSNDTASSMNLVITEGNIRFQRDYYIELSDRAPDLNALY